MPTYEYECDACGHHFAAEQRITAEPLKSCPACKKKKLKRLITSGNFLLKGGGWYKDGYAASTSASSASATPAATPAAAPAPCAKEKSAPACASCPANAKKG